MEGFAGSGRSPSSTRTIIFDGDDTLWMTQTIYQSIMAEFYAKLVDEGFDRLDAQKAFTAINQDLLDKIKLSTDRLGRAMAMTYELLCHAQDRRVEPALSRECVELAQQVFIRTPGPLPHLNSVLPCLAEAFELVFYSGGDEATQRRRLAGLGLDHLFQDRVYIVQQKDDMTLSTILAKRSIDPKTAWIVGNSPRFEVNPGLRLGLRSIWMHTSFWKFDLEDVSEAKTSVAFSLDEVRNIVFYGSASGSLDYQPTLSEARAFQAELSTHMSRSELWVIANSPKLDLNPALSVGCNVIWMPTSFDTVDIEPLYGDVYVAFSREGAERIVRQQKGARNNSVKVIYRVREHRGDLGGSLVVE